VLFQLVIVEFLLQKDYLFAKLERKINIFSETLAIWSNSIVFMQKAKMNFRENAKTKTLASTLQVFCEASRGGEDRYVKEEVEKGGDAGC
jgi:hypothetical protein